MHVDELAKHIVAELYTLQTVAGCALSNLSHLCIVEVAAPVFVSDGLDVCCGAGIFVALPKRVKCALVAARRFEIRRTLQLGQETVRVVILQYRFDDDRPHIGTETTAIGIQQVCVSREHCADRVDCGLGKIASF